MMRWRVIPLRVSLAVGWVLLFVSTHLSVWAAEPVNSIGIVDARAFLDEYRSFSEAQSVSFYDLYSDRAVVHAHIQGQDKGIAFQGRAYKRWGSELLQNGHGVLDASVFRDATVEQRGNRLVLRAQRYSTTRCYWDATYQAGIEKEGMSYRIVDERLTTNPAARCDASNAMVVAPAVTAPFSAGPLLSSSLAAPRASVDSSWQPMSQDEIAATAMRIAQQAVANTSPQGRAMTPPLIGAPAVLAGAATAVPAMAVRAQSVKPPSTLWITPQE